mmetsp:Transcript_54903/g.103027  ORF Transcript_54903/g.103027 Transcript_54903/m.103027 type:complete len:213 (-) Transcript_54903:1453-2091(-)
MSDCNSSAPNGSAISLTHRFRSFQNVKAIFKSSRGCTQHGNLASRSLWKFAGVASCFVSYSRKNLTTIPMQARGSMKVGINAGVCRWSSFFGEAHMKPRGKSLAFERSLSKIDASDASTSCRRARFKMRTSEWNAARSNSTSAFHMSFFSFIGTSDMTRLSKSTDLTRGFTGARGYSTCCGKGRSGEAASKGSPERTPNFIISRATRHGSWS